MVMKKVMKVMKLNPKKILKKFAKRQIPKKNGKTSTASAIQEGDPPGAAALRLEAMQGQMSKIPILSFSQRQALLDAKCQVYKETDGKGVQFTPGETKNLYSRWAHAEQSAPEEVRSIWQGICAKPSGSEAAKRGVLFAWLRDNKFGDHFFQAVQSVTHKMQMDRTIKWLTKKQMEDTFGDEAQERMNDGSHVKRTDPQNSKFFQWMKKSDKSVHSRSKEQKVNTMGSAKISSDDFHSLNDSMSMSVMNESVLDHFASGGDLVSLGKGDVEVATAYYQASEAGDADDAASKRLRKFFASHDEKPDGKGDQKKTTIEKKNTKKKTTIEEAADGSVGAASKEEAYVKAQQMMALIEGRLTLMQVTQHKAARGKFQPSPKLMKATESSIKTMQKHIHILRTVVVEQSASTPKVIAILKEAALFMRDTCKEIQTHLEVSSGSKAS
jgi:hypothetical protein